MNTISTVFRKELIDTLRDRRTLLFAIVIPLLVFPLLFRVMFSVEKKQAEREKNRSLEVVCIDNGNAPGFADAVRATRGITVVEGVAADSVRSWVRRDSIDGAFIVSPDFDETTSALGAGRIDVYYRTTSDREIVRRRLEKIVDAYEERLLAERFERLELPREASDGVALKAHNLASAQERIGKTVGGFLPYLFILFSFLGAVYPAIDLGAGEKERGTLETLLTAPVSRFHILLGKFGVVVLSGLMSAVVSMVGLYIGFKQAAQLPPEFETLVVKILGWKTILLVFSLLLPLAVFFAGLLLSVSITARGFKEAQSLISPLNIAVIIPAAIGLVPGVELTPLTALIPVLNVSLATKEIVAGTVNATNLGIAYASLIALAVAALYGSAFWFRRESTIFRA